MGKTYWENAGKHQELANKLNAKLPPSGPVTEPNSHFLERFRQFSNAYYDVFNNGGCNRRDVIADFFGDEIIPLLFDAVDDCAPSPVRDMDWRAIHRLTEPRMNRIIMSAAKEQHLV